MAKQKNKKEYYSGTELEVITAPKDGKVLMVVRDETGRKIVVPLSIETTKRLIVDLHEKAASLEKSTSPEPGQQRVRRRE